MRILMLSDVYFPRINGVSTSIETVASELRKIGHSVTLIAPSYGYGKYTDDSTIRIASRRVPFDPEDRIMKMADVAALAPELVCEDFDIIHVHTPFAAHYAGIKLARKLNLPVVESYHTYFEEYLYHYIPFLPKPFLRYLARRYSLSQSQQVDGLIIPSTAMRNVLESYGVKTDYDIIPTGVQPEQFVSADGNRFRLRHEIGLSRPMLLHVGRVAFEKNISFLLKVVARVKINVPDVLFVIAGEGPALDELQVTVSDLDLQDNVRFIGYLDRFKDLPDCYGAANCMIFASATETQGLVLLESMAAGTPLVSTAVMGTKDVLRDGQGVLVARQELADFAEKVTSILLDSDLRQRLATSGRNYVQNWSPDVLTDRLVRFYERTVEKSQLPTACPATVD